MKIECGIYTSMSVGQLNYCLEKMEEIPFSLNFKFQKLLTSFNLVNKVPEIFFPTLQTQTHVGVLKQHLLWLFSAKVLRTYLCKLQGSPQFDPCTRRLCLGHSRVALSSSQSWAWWCGCSEAPWSVVAEDKHQQYSQKLFTLVCAFHSNYLVNLTILINEIQII